MEQILSQEEIDALLKGISEGDIDTEQEDPAEQAAEAQSFDWARFTRWKKDRLPALDFIYDRFSKSFQSALSLYLEKEVAVTLEPLQYVPYGEFIRTLSLPTNLNVVVTEKLKGFFIVIFDPQIIFCVLETIFGSSSTSGPLVEGREFTRIEFNVIKKITELLCVEMEKAWSPVYEIVCKFSRSEVNPKYVTIISEEEVVSLTEITIEIADIKGWVKICMPYGLLETIKGYLISTPSREDEEMREKWFMNLRERVYEVPLELRAVLGKKRTSLKAFLQMVNENMIFVDRYVNDPIEIDIHNKDYMKGRLGLYKGNKAVRIDEIL